MIIGYPIGIPLMYFLLLCKQNDKIDLRQAKFATKMSDEKALVKALKMCAAIEEKHLSLRALSFLYGVCGYRTHSQ